MRRHDPHVALGLEGPASARPSLGESVEFLAIVGADRLRPLTFASVEDEPGDFIAPARGVVPAPACRPTPEAHRFCARFLGPYAANCRAMNG
jgi:hypothetical protein